MWEKAGVTTVALRGSKGSRQGGWSKAEAASTRILAGSPGNEVLVHSL